MRYIVFIFLLLPSASYAQLAPIIMPPSPEASSVFKFTEIPVSLYTGMSNITIPLYNIKVGDFQIPITLNYHGRGMKVQEIASHVGSGWSLNYGGMISRQIRGKADDAVKGYLNEDYYNEVFTDMSVNSNVLHFYEGSYSSDGIDLIPDMYLFKLVKKSGKFFLDQNDKSVVLQHFSDTRISFIQENGRIEGWVVTDDAGNKYYFGMSKDRQRSASDYPLNVYSYSYERLAHGYAEVDRNQDRFIDTWHLMEIETYRHEFIKFKYEREDISYYQWHHDVNVGSSNVMSYFSKIKAVQFQIKEIDFTNGKIKFLSSTKGRKDLKGSHALDRIEIIDNNNQLIKAYNFQYIYPQTVQDNNQLSHLEDADSTCNYRLFLHSIQEEGNTGVSLSPYIFCYNIDAIPNRFSTSQDKWGYYNGKANGQFMPFFNYSLHNINRDVDTSKSKAGLLKKITYPDGGTVSFIREQNMYSTSDGTQKLGPGKRIKKILYSNGNKKIKEKEYTYTDPVTNQSSGILFSVATPDYVIRYHTINSLPYFPIFYPSSSFPLSNFQENNMGYSFVTEYEGSIQINTGKTEYEYTTTRDAGKYKKFPFPLPVDNEWQRGKPLSIRIYESVDNGYFLRKKITNSYTHGVFPTPLLPVGQKFVYEKDSTHCYLPLIVYSKDTLFPYNYSVYYQMGGTMDLSSTTVTEYPDTGSPMETTTEYYYNYSKHYQVSRIDRTTSSGDYTTTKFYYPPDIANPSTVIQALIDSNRIKKPLKVVDIMRAKTSGTELSRTTHVTKFKNWGNDIIAPESLQTAYNSNPLETVTQFYAYDTHGNPTEIAQRDGIHTVYLWGNSGQYPVAKVTGSNYNTVSNLIDQDKLDNAANYSDTEIRNELNKIRTGLSGSNAQVWTYTYAPLLGISSETTPGRHITYYNYDSFGRLSTVRDEQKKILKKYDYHHYHIYYNTAQSQTFSRQCDGDYTGSSVVYTVPDSTYTSTISQADANQKALDDISTNGQAYADTHGVCTLTIYATLSTSGTNSIFEFGCLNQYSDIIIRFYEDAAHTIPYSVNNLQVEVKKTTIHYMNSQPITTTYSNSTYNCSGSSHTLSNQLIYHACVTEDCFPNICLPRPDDPYTTHSFSLVEDSFTFTQ